MIANKDLYRKRMTGILGYLHALYWQHWNTHWKVQGDPYYGDHLLFQRLYEAIPEELDTTAEKIIQTLGSQGFDSNTVLTVSMRLIDLWKKDTSNPIELSYYAERMFQSVLDTAFKSLEAANSLPLGHNDFIAAVANTHETHLYLITQRLRAQQEKEQEYAKMADVYFTTTRSAAEIGENQPDNLPLDSEENVEKDQKGNPKNVSDAANAEHHFWDNPEKREVREFAESKAKSNVGVPGTPPTPDEIKKQPGAEDLSTLTRFKVDK